MPAAEARIILRRAGVGVAAGMLSMLALAGVALEMRHQPHWWVVLTVSLAAAGFLGLLSTVPALRAATRVRPVEPGSGGDLSDDLAGWTPAILPGRPWTVALLLTAFIFAALTAAGIVADDPYDGALRGLLDAAACLAGFALLGPYLGLWSRRAV